VRIRAVVYCVCALVDVMLFSSSLALEMMFWCQDVSVARMTNFLSQASWG
jgi:hypothetical protein